MHHIPLKFDLDMHKDVKVVAIQLWKIYVSKYPESHVTTQLNVHHPIFQYNVMENV